MHLIVIEIGVVGGADEVVAEWLCHVLVDSQTTRILHVHSRRREHRAEPDEAQPVLLSQRRTRLAGLNDVRQSIAWNLLVLLDAEELRQSVDRHVLVAATDGVPQTKSEQSVSSYGSDKCWIRTKLRSYYTMFTSLTCNALILSGERGYIGPARSGRRRPPQTYATAAFGEGRVREGADEQSQRASCEPLTAVAEREDSILRLSRHPAP